MAVAPDQLMQMIKSQKDAATPGGVPSADGAPTSMSDSATPPMGSPMSTPEPKMGNREASMINIGMATDLLEQALPALGSESPEGQKILNAIRTISGIIGPRKARTGELQQSEILQLLQNLPQAGGLSPEAKVMAGAPAVPGMSPTGQPTPPPPLAPPGGMKPPGGAGLPPPGGGLPPPM